MEKERVKSKKTKKIFSKIFWPIVQLIVLFAVISFLLNYFSIDKFVKDNAKEKINQAYNNITKQLDEFANSGDNEFVLKPDESLVNQNNNSKVYVFDKNFKEVSLFDNSISIDNSLLDFLSSLLMDYELEENVLTTIVFGNKEYLVNTYVASSALNIEEKYFVVLQDLTDKTNLLKESIRNTLFVQLIVLLLIVLTIYKIAKDLSKPLTKLEKESKEYVIGHGVTITSDKITTEEVESLRSALYEMQEKAEEEDRRKNTVYENVAHDLRTPLVSILGYADGLKSNIIKDKDKACEIILRTGNQLKEMIENILVLSRFDNDTYKKSYEDINLTDLIVEQIETLKVTDDRKKIVFRNATDGQSIIHSDRKLLVRIIQNLLSNAIKYAKETITIELKTADDENYTYNISIKDDGMGIEKENTEDIFTRYYKGEDGHFGIGLAVVKSAIEHLKGEVILNSKIGKETEFTVKI